MTADDFSGDRRWDTAARSGSGWPASGSGPSVAPASSGGSAGASCRSTRRAIDRAGGAGGPVIALRGVGVRREGTVVLDDVDWSVQPGERWVILGPNGSGKTTLLTWPGARLWPTPGRWRYSAPASAGSMCGRLRPRISLVSGSVTRQLRADLPARDVVVSGRYGALETWWNRYGAEDWAAGRPACSHEAGCRRDRATTRSG